MDWSSNILGNIQFTAWLFQRCLAVLYLVAFIAVLDQFPALLGEKGLLPTPRFTRVVPFKQTPSIFHFHYSDRYLRAVAWTGFVVSALLILAVPDHLPWWVATVSWLVLWALYLSIVNVGQIFFSFGWESMLVEAGFFAAFIGAAPMVASTVPIMILRWMLFRVEFGAGMIKIRHDTCWRDLTCLYYHHETQPMPNPLSWYFHHLPKRIHRYGVVFSHIVQLAVPWGLFAPQPIAAIAGAVIIFHQLLLIVSGNYAWLNWLTVVLGITAFNDATLGATALPWFHQTAIAFPAWYQAGMQALLAIAILLSVQPAINLFSAGQLMNYNFNPLHLINAYGAFGTISRQRFEVVLEGTEDSVISVHTIWKEYGFKGKPGRLNRRPAQFAPYHLRLDWLMWFIPFSIMVVGRQIATYGYEMWFVRLVEKLLRGDAQTLKLLASNPFPHDPPKFVRARYYLYEFTKPEERKQTGDWWKRTLIGDYLPPVKLSDISSALDRSTAPRI
jgi:hypothetical protein